MLVQLRGLAESAFSRAAGAPLLCGNQVKLLEDAAQNYPLWLEAIAGAKRRILFENYLVHDDAIGRQFAEALAFMAGLVLCLLGVLVVLFPRALAYTLGTVALWAGVVFLGRAWRLYRRLRHPDRVPPESHP